MKNLKKVCCAIMLGLAIMTATTVAGTGEPVQAMGDRPADAIACAELSDGSVAYMYNSSNGKFIVEKDGKVEAKDFIPEFNYNGSTYVRDDSTLNQHYLLWWSTTTEISYVRK